MRVLIVAAALLTVVVPAAESATRSTGATRLSISVWPEGRADGKPVRNFTLRCRPPGGGHPAPGRACGRLFANLSALRPVPANRVCASRQGGRQQAFLSGRVKGRRIRTAFNRSNSCEIERWDRLAPLFRAQDPAISLQITVWPEGPGERSFTTSLTCNPPGGTHPRPAKACERILALEDPFGPLPYEMPCKLAASGPEAAVVRGGFRGKAVEARFDRSDSCETIRWERIAIVFAAP
jgi:Subtilisin inhibitor-like